MNCEAKYSDLYQQMDCLIIALFMHFANSEYKLNQMYLLRITWFRRDYNSLAFNSACTCTSPYLQRWWWWRWRRLQRWWWCVAEDESISNALHKCQFVIKLMRIEEFSFQFNLFVIVLYYFFSSFISETHAFLLESFNKDICYRKSSQHYNVNYLPLVNHRTSSCICL